MENVFIVKVKFLAVIDYKSITSNRKYLRLQITVNYLKNSNQYNRLRFLDYDYPMPDHNINVCYKILRQKLKIFLFGLINARSFI